MTTTTIRTYGCPNCPYYQDFNPSDTIEMARQFPECQDLPVGHCPACFMGRNPQCQRLSSEMALLITPAMQTNVSSDAQIESTQVPDFDEHGQPIMVQTGTRQEIGIVDGKVGVVEVPVMEQQMRQLTDEELAELKLQRDQNLDKLEAVAVSEI